MRELIEFLARVREILDYQLFVLGKAPITLMTRFSVTSDLNYAIDAAFRENDINIPFPQRDVHIIQET